MTASRFCRASRDGYSTRSRPNRGDRDRFADRRRDRESHGRGECRRGRRPELGGRIGGLGTRDRVAAAQWPELPGTRAPHARQHACAKFRSDQGAVGRRLVGGPGGPRRQHHDRRHGRQRRCRRRTAAEHLAGRGPGISGGDQPLCRGTRAIRGLGHQCRHQVRRRRDAWIRRAVSSRSPLAGASRRPSIASGAGDPPFDRQQASFTLRRTAPPNELFCVRIAGGDGTRTAGCWSARAIPRRNPSCARLRRRRSTTFSARCAWTGALGRSGRDRPLLRPAGKRCGHERARSGDRHGVATSAIAKPTARRPRIVDERPVVARASTPSASASAISTTTSRRWRRASS